MYLTVHPKLPMRDKSITKKYYLNALGFKEVGGSYEEYLMVKKDAVELHFFLFQNLNPLENYGQIYLRTEHIDKIYQSLLNAKVPIHPNGALEIKPWGQKEFSLLDPDHNLLTFGEGISSGH